MKQRIRKWLLILMFLSLQMPSSIGSEKNLYQILGVRKSATTKQIKAAYRRKALDTHPDKNKNVPIEQATADFQAVVQAFEILSDKTSRRIYDQTGRTDGHFRPQQQNRHGFYQTSNRQQQQRQRKRNRMRDQPNVREAMARVLRVSSLSQLKTIILRDDEFSWKIKTFVEDVKREEIQSNNDTMKISQQETVQTVVNTTTRIRHKTAERHLLMAFVPVEYEYILDDEIVFPYPFAGMSKQGVWWEEFLQTAKVLYQGSTKLTQYFEIDTDATGPTFIFVPQNATLKEYQKYSTHRRDKFTHWVWEQLMVDLEFYNYHSHPIQIWYVYENNQKLQSTLEPNHIASISCRLGHTFWIRDARVNQHISEQEIKRRRLATLTHNSTLEIVKVVTPNAANQHVDPSFHTDDGDNNSKDEDQQKSATNVHINIVELKVCFDLATDCTTQRHGGNCTKQTPYTQKYCQKTCKICNEQDDKKARQERARCQDFEASCRSWARRGMCQEYYKYMRHHCPKSCNFCSDDCQDLDSNCRGWALNGDCQRNENFMRYHCANTCRFCSVDDGNDKKNKKKERSVRISSSDSDSDDEDVTEEDFLYSSDDSDDDDEEVGVDGERQHDEL